MVSLFKSMFDAWIIFCITSKIPASHSACISSITIIGKKSYNIENKLFFDTTKKYINFKEEVNINEENIIKEIDPHLLSFNFYEIFSDNVKKEKAFKLIQAQMV